MDENSRIFDCPAAFGHGDFIVVIGCVSPVARVKVFASPHGETPHLDRHPHRVSLSILLGAGADGFDELCLLPGDGLGDSRCFPAQAARTAAAAFEAAEAGRGVSAGGTPGGRDDGLVLAMRN
jgi:hypothetical protein